MKVVYPLPVFGLGDSEFTENVLALGRMIVNRYLVIGKAAALAKAAAMKEFETGHVLVGRFRNKVVDTLTAEESQYIFEEFLTDAPAPVIFVDYQLIDPPAAIALAQGVHRNQPQDNAVIFSQVNRRTDVEIAGKPVLPEFQSAAQDLLFLAEAFIGHRSILVTEQGSHLGGIGTEEGLYLYHLLPTRAERLFNPILVYF